MLKETVFSNAAWLGADRFKSEKSRHPRVNLGSNKQKCLSEISKPPADRNGFL